jgi:hypothetical protein
LSDFKGDLSMRGKRIRQINNLTITYTDVYGYAVWASRTLCLEDRLTLDEAVEFCKETTDYINK